MPTLLIAALLMLAADPPATNVGMHGRLSDVVLPGPELEVIPLENRRGPFVLRIDEARRHGTAFRYDFDYYGLEPGTYDLTKFLRPKDNSPAVALPPLTVTVTSLLPAGQVLPHQTAPRRASWFVGYRLLLVVLGGWWLVGLLIILFWRRPRKSVLQGRPERPATVADRLRPLVLKAKAGTLTPHERAELERTLLAYWRGRLGLEHERAADAIARLRSHPEAGELLGQLEAWLHRPDASATVDVNSLLRPYEHADGESASPPRPPAERAERVGGTGA